MSETMNVLKEQNSTKTTPLSIPVFGKPKNQPKKIINKCNPHHASHATTSAQNFTPKNNKYFIKPLESSSKKENVNSIRKSNFDSVKKSLIVNSVQKSTPFSSSSSATKPRFSVNPIYNGIDYTGMMSKKAELGYTGPGYVVEYDCQPSHLRGLVIEKGLYKVTLVPNQRNDLIRLFNRPRLDVIRIDVDDTSKTPMKPGSLLPRFDFDFNKSASKQTPAPNMNISYSADSINIDGNMKKRVRFIESDMDRISEKSGISSQLSTPMNIDLSGGKKLRRSLSCSDANAFLISENPVKCDSSSFTFTVKNYYSSPCPIENLNETYDKLSIDASVHLNIAGISPLNISISPRYKYNLPVPNSLDSICQQMVQYLQNYDEKSLVTIVDNDTEFSNHLENITKIQNYFETMKNLTRLKD